MFRTSLVLILIITVVIDSKTRRCSKHGLDSSVGREFESHFRLSIFELSVAYLALGTPTA